MRTTLEETNTHTCLDIADGIDSEIDDVAVPAEIIRNDEEARGSRDANALTGEDGMYDASSSTVSTSIGHCTKPIVICPADSQSAWQHRRSASAVFPRQAQVVQVL